MQVILPRSLLRRVEDLPHFMKRGSHACVVFQRFCGWQDESSLLYYLAMIIIDLVSGFWTW